MLCVYICFLPSLSSKILSFFFFFFFFVFLSCEMTILPTPVEQILNCNLELCLSPPSSHPANHAAVESTTARTSPHPNTHKLALFNRAGFPVTDITELQARSIIIQATRQMEEKRSSTCRVRAEEATSPAEQQSMANPSMKRSLQRFLQKRKHRIQTFSPYTH